jgi:hypothetical protein
MAGMVAALRSRMMTPSTIEGADLDTVRGGENSEAPPAPAPRDPRVDRLVQQITGSLEAISKTRPSAPLAPIPSR